MTKDDGDGVCVTRKRLPGLMARRHRRRARRRRIDERGREEEAEKEECGIWGNLEEENL